MLAVIDVSGINAAQIGLVLTYTSASCNVVIIFYLSCGNKATLAQMGTHVIRQTADVEVVHSLYLCSAPRYSNAFLASELHELSGTT